MSNESYYKYFRSIPIDVKIIDYSEENIEYFKNVYKNINLIPPIFYNNNKLNFKDIDILSLKNNEYRSNILESLIFDNCYRKMYFNEVYKNERDKLYNRSKIYINIHASKDHKTMELIRIINLLINKVIVITQNSINPELLFISKYLIICDKDYLLETKVKEVLKNYNHYYENFFLGENSFNKNIYKKYLDEHINNFTNY